MNLLLIRIFRFYRDGFREMSPLGRSLWVLILIKLFIMFAVLKLFFFPDLLARFDDDRQRSDFIMQQLSNTNTE